MERLYEDVLAIFNTHNLVKVNFRKNNGDLRTMVCTRNAGLIPTSHLPSKFKEEKLVNKDILKVYDVESEGWRSFRVDAVEDISVDI